MSIIPEEKWLDITKQLAAASRSLPIGLLIKDENFGLFEAMSAIELMDPKMDAGMLCNKELCQVSSADEAIDKGLLPLSPSLEDVAGVSDEILSCICTWLDGHSLAQTVLTCLYLHCIPRIESPILVSICNAVLKSCELINYIISSSGCFEEEDFITCTYGYNVSPNMSTSKVIALLKEGEDEINKKVKRGEKILANESAILQRLSFWKYFVIVLQKIQIFEKKNIEALKGDLTKLFHSVSPIKSTVSVGTQAVVSNEKHRKMVGFEYLINQKLLSSTPPRYIAIMERNAMCEYLMRLFAHIELMLRIGESSSLSSIIRFFVRFSEQNPCVLSRSCLFYIFLIGDNVLGVEPLTKIIKEEIKSFSYPISFFTPYLGDANVKSFVTNFLDGTALCIQDYIQAMCHNKGRQRRKLGALLCELNELYKKSENFDNMLHAYLSSSDSLANHLRSFSCWVLFITVEVMIKYLLLGWELELYGIHEAHYIYCYLEYLFSWLRQTIICGQDQVTAGEILEKKLAKRNKNMKRKKKDKSNQMVLQMTNVYQMMSHGYIKALEGFALQGKFDVFMDRTFDNEDLRFRQRFAPFNITMPIPLEMSKYPTMRTIVETAPEGKEHDLFKESLDNFTQVREILNKIPAQHSVDSLAKVVKMNCVQMSLVVNGHCKDSKNPPLLDFSICQNVPFVKVT